MNLLVRSPLYTYTPCLMPTSSRITGVIPPEPTKSCKRGNITLLRAMEAVLATMDGKLGMQ